MDIWKYVRCEPYTKDKNITRNDADDDDNDNISNIWIEAQMGK
jgi:hypothetical protein